VVIGKGHIAATGDVARAVERCWERWGVWALLPGGRIDQRGRFRFPAGLVPELVRELERDGYRVEVADRRRDDLNADAREMEQAQGADRRYLEALARNPVGVVEVTGHTELVARVAQLAALYPGARVVVAVPTRKRAWKVWERLGEELGGPVGLVTAQGTRPGRRCTVCTYQSLGKVKGREESILVVVEAERAVHRVAEYAVGERAYARVYGFVYAGVTRDGDADLGLRVLAGEVIHAVPSTAAVARVLMVESPALPTKVGGRGLGRKRRAVWGNRPRNRLVARVAQALCEGDVDTLRECGLELGEDELGGEGRRVAVLVESTAHARELRSLLRGWPVYSVVPLEMRGHADEESLDSTSKVKGSVVTLLYAAVVGTDADVIVRATGGRGEWPAEDVRAERGGGRPRALLVIDFVDDLDDQARNDTRLRVRDYAHQGFPVGGATSPM
jgi:hypothetical protein